VSNTSNEANDSKDSNQISEAECDQHQQPTTQNYGGKLKSYSTHSNCIINNAF